MLDLEIALQHKHDQRMQIHSQQAGQIRDPGEWHPHVHKQKKGKYLGVEPHELHHDMFPDALSEGAPPPREADGPRALRLSQAGRCNGEAMLLALS